MAFNLANFQDPQLSDEYLAYMIDRQSSQPTMSRKQRWDYFRNPLLPIEGPTSRVLNSNSRPYFQAQEVGLPARITGIFRSNASNGTTDLRRKEVVIENDIAWRIHTMVDFLFGKPVTIKSLAPDPHVAGVIETVLDTILDANGGIGLLQEIALLGSIYGFIDIALRTPAGYKPERFGSLFRPQSAPSTEALPGDGPSRPGTSKNGPETASGDGSDSGKKSFKPERLQDSDRAGSRTALRRVLASARKIQLETIEAPRVLPILDENEYTHTRYWIQRFHKCPSRLAGSKRAWFHLGKDRQAQAVVEVVEIFGPSWWQRYEDRVLVAEGPNALGRIPIVHVQNLAMPGSYEGQSDVEPLIPLQDELNTRLSDRANRVTYQSFKMYLGKGIDDFLERPVGPGQMWATQNLDARIEEFGTDTGSPSEDAHIEEVRQAMDKVSGVTPLAAGLVRGNIGHLTSATALKVLLSGLLMRTAKKRLTYGRGLQAIAKLCLEWLARTGVLHTAPEDRRTEVLWSNPLPTDESEQLRNAQTKIQLGVPQETVLSELGYSTQDTRNRNI